MDINWVIIAQAVAALGAAWHLYRKERNGMEKGKILVVGNDKFVNFSELERHCKTAHEGIVKAHEKDLLHLKELIEKDLENGRRKFDELGRRFDDFGNKLDQFQGFLIKNKE